MNKNRKKAVSLVGEKQVRKIEQAFNHYLTCWIGLARKSVENLHPYDFFSNYLADRDVYQDDCQAFRELNSAGIDLQLMVDQLWVECEPTDMEEC